MVDDFRLGGVSVGCVFVWVVLGADRVGGRGVGVGDVFG